MAGSNVIAAYYGGTGRNQILSQTLASGTETELKIGNDAGATNVIAVLSVPQQTNIVGSATPLDQSQNPAILDGGFTKSGYPGGVNPPFNSDVFDNNKPFLLRLAGTFTPASNAGNTLDIKVYLGTSKSGTLIGDTGAVAQASTTTSGGFLIELELSWSKLATNVRGQQWYTVDGTTPVYNTWKAVTGVGTAAAVANLQFCASVTWGNAVGGVVAASEFSLSQL